VSQRFHLAVDARGAIVQRSMVNFGARRSRRQYAVVTEFERLRDG